MRDLLPTAREITQLFPGVWQWSAYSSHHKVELTSHAVNTSEGVVIVDPIPLDEEQRIKFEPIVAPQAVILTNANHLRSATQWVDRKSIYAFPSSLTREHGLVVIERQPSQLFGLTIIPLEGGPAGEIALFDSDKKLLIVGDALVNLPNRGLEILPAKYCNDDGMLRNSLCRLLAFNFDVLLCSHGNPILTAAKTRLKELLA